ncbi:MAG: hypothetical protein H6728_00105 [Myxococcales bacterium]|nr:hypothetical protein [Myxococcales bacterium]MCB9641464.1 hypothetical protein [Myxococcales bacterium]
MKTLQRFLSVSLLFTVFACVAPSDPNNGTVLQASSIQQSTCNASDINQTPGDPEGKESYTLTPKGNQIEISYKNAPFRCDQKVTWEAALSGQVVTATVRPEDMDPTTVARCGCRYDVSAMIGTLSQGKYTIKIVHKTDNYGSPSTSQEVHSEDVQIP